MSACEVCEVAADHCEQPEAHDCASMAHHFAALIGRRVTSVLLERGECTLWLNTDGGWMFANTSADCCSQTWFADILGVSELLSGRVVAVRDIDVDGPDSDERSRQESDKHYGIEVTTFAGVCRIIYRNSSNGYYGGDVDKLRPIDRGPPDDAHEIRSDYP